MSNRGRILIVVIPVMVLLVGAGGAFVFLRGARKAKPAEERHSVTLSDLTVNLADTRGPSYLSASVTISLVGPEAREAAKEAEAKIRDSVIIVISGNTYVDLLSADGKQHLKDEISEAVSEALASRHVKVEEVLFTSFVME